MKKSKAWKAACRTARVALCLVPLSVVPLAAGAAETDRITVQDPATGYVMFRVTSAGNVTGASFTGDGSKLTNVAPTQAQILSEIAKKSDGTVATGAPMVLDTSINSGAAGTATFLIQGNANKERFELRTANSLVNQITPSFQSKGAGGTLAAPEATPATAVLCSLGGSGHDGTQWVAPNRAFISMRAAENWTPGSQGAYITFETTPIGSAGSAGTRLERVRIADSGNVGIGITAPSQKLEVAGGVKLAPSGTKPTCGSNARGTFWFTNGGSGKDIVEVCAQDAYGYLAWRQLY